MPSALHTESCVTDFKSLHYRNWMVETYSESSAIFHHTLNQWKWVMNDRADDEMAKKEKRWRKKNWVPHRTQWAMHMCNAPIMICPLFNTRSFAFEWVCSAMKMWRRRWWCQVAGFLWLMSPHSGCGYLAWMLPSFYLEAHEKMVALNDDNGPC